MTPTSDFSNSLDPVNGFQSIVDNSVKFRVEAPHNPRFCLLNQDSECLERRIRFSKSVQILTIFDNASAKLPASSLLFFFHPLNHLFSPFSPFLVRNPGVRGTPVKVIHRCLPC